MNLCGYCLLPAEWLGECVKCKKRFCVDCSLPALLLGPDGRVVEGSDEPGKVLCCACNPPSGGHGARIKRAPTPDPWYAVLA